MRTRPSYREPEVGSRWMASYMDVVTILLILFVAFAAQGLGRLEHPPSPAALPMVGQIADVLRQTPGKISLVGHADATPIHNRHFKNNWELSLARGLRLLELLQSQYGIPESRLSIASHGAQDPRSPNTSPEGRAANRRVEIVIQDGAAP